MDYNQTKNNLEKNIELLNHYIENNSPASFAKYFLVDIANSKGFEIVSFNDSIYIKKGEYPKAILHLNIDVRNDSNTISISDQENIISGKNLPIINSLLLIATLIDQYEDDFDVLLTNSNIQNDSSNFDNLSSFLRSDNIINLNLRQGRCIADEFSALKLSKVSIPIERYEASFEYHSYRLSISNLLGGRAGEDIDKVRLNSIKSLISFIRKIKSKVDLEVTGFEAGDRYDRIPSQGQIYFIINKDYENDLIDSFTLFKNELIEKNLKHEPDMQINLDKMEDGINYPLKESSFNHLASFVELVPTGAFSFNNETSQLISSINLSSSRTYENHINFIVVFRSLSDGIMDQMIEKTRLATEISKSTLTDIFEIPKWKNKDDSLTNAFINSYKEFTEDILNVIKTQYSLDSSIIFNNLNVKMISLGVEYNQGEDNTYYSSLADLILTANVLDSALSHL